MWRLGLGVVILLGGCTLAGNDLSKVVEQMAKDPATACASVTYAGATGRFFRTNIPNGKVSCNDNGMTVESTSPAKP